jgi:single-strand DNA-binding protein
MEIVARIVSDAQVSEMKSGKRVVNFSVAINDYYKPKNGEGVQLTTFARCSYWVSPAIAPRLVKGALVQLYGRIAVGAFTNKSGEAVGVLNFHVSSIKLHTTKQGATASTAQTGQSVTTAGFAGSEDTDDLPF